MNCFSRWILSSLAGIFTLAGALAPALANVTTAALAATKPSYSGSCPVTMAFSGTITGSPGTTFQYSFNRFINGVQQVQSAPGSFTLPASGTLAVSDSFAISSTSAAVNFDQIWVHNITGGQGDVYSLRSPFSVTCGATPTPAPSGGAAVTRFPHGASAYGHATQLVYGVPPPYNLANTTDPHVCKQHGGFAGVFCIQAVPDKYLILIWDWDPNDRWPAIDGYHVYDVTGGGKTRVQDQTNPQATIEFFKPGSFTGKCYAVSAYKGANESPTSASFCVAGAQVGLKSITDSSPAAGSRHEQYTYGMGDMPNNDCDNPCIGFYYAKTMSLGMVQTHWNLIQRGYMSFYPRGVTLRGLNVAKATLTVSLDTSMHRPDPKGDSFACLGAVGAAKTNWIASKAFADGDFGYDVPMTLNGNSASFDVTRIVRDWANGTIADYGFVFKGKSEELGSDANDFCQLYLTPNGTLTIDYYP